MLSNLIRNVLSSAISGVINGSGGGNTPPLNERYFTQLDGQSKYWRRIEPDYGQTTTATLECSFFGKSGSGFEYLIGRNSNDRFYIGLNSSGDVGYAKGGSNFSGQTTVDLTKINHAKLVADGTDVKFYVNSVLIATQAQGWSGLLDEVGFGVKGDQLLDFYSGILVSARVTTDTVDNVYGLDTNLPYDLPDGVELGPELIQNGKPVDASVWGANNSTLSVTSDGYMEVLGVAPSNTNMNQSFFTELGKKYSVSFNNKKGTAPNNQQCVITAVSGGSTIVNQSVTAGPNNLEFIGIGAGTRISLGFGETAAGQTSLWRNISIREMPNSALIFENGSVDQSDRLLVTEKQDGSGFNGEEFWADSVKAVSGNATALTDNSITINETGTTLAAIGISAPAGPVTVSGVATITSGQVDISVIPNFSGVAASITSSGTFSFDLDSQGAVNFKRAFNGGAVAEITDIKVKARYDYAAGAVPVDSYGTEYSTAYS